MSKLVIVEQHDCEYFAFFCIYKRDIMQLFSSDATLFKKKFCPWKQKNCPQKLLIFCLIKMASCAIIIEMIPLLNISTYYVSSAVYYKATLRNVVNTTISSSWVVNICPHLQGFWSLSLNLWYLFLDTLESGINVGLRLLIFWLCSMGYIP